MRVRGSLAADQHPGLSAKAGRWGQAWLQSRQRGAPGPADVSELDGSARSGVGLEAGPSHPQGKGGGGRIGRRGREEKGRRGREVSPRKSDSGQSEQPWGGETGYQVTYLLETWHSRRLPPSPSSSPCHARDPPAELLIDSSKGQANPCLCAFGYTVLCLNCFSLAYLA